MPIHPTALVSQDAQLDSECSIGPYCVIEGPVRIGSGTVTGPYVHILGDTEIGRDCRIHAGCVLGDLPQDRAYSGDVTYCRIGDGTVLREHVTVHRGTAAGSATIVGQRCLLMAGAHVGHNCCLGDEVTMANGAMLGGYVEVGPRAILSGNVGVHQFVRIGELAMIGGLAKITQDVVPYFMVDGAGTCVGVNRIGMRRAGRSAEDIADAILAYRQLCRTPGSLQSALLQLETSLSTPAGRGILQFMKTPSRRGFHLRESASAIP